MPARPRPHRSELFDELDADGDGLLSEAEVRPRDPIVLPARGQVLAARLRLGGRAANATDSQTSHPPNRNAQGTHHPRRGPALTLRGPRAGQVTTCIGMIKCDLLETMQLERSFLSFRQPADGGKRGGEEAVDPSEALHATDLVAALGVSLEEAEEMIFIADLKDNQSSA